MAPITSGPCPHKNREIPHPERELHRSARRMALTDDNGRSNGAVAEVRAGVLVGIFAFVLLGSIGILGLAVGRPGAGSTDHAQHLPGDTEGGQPTLEADGSFATPPPPWRDEDMFPCSECHDPEELPPNPKRRPLEMAHEEIVLVHDEEHRWCLDCHDEDNRDKLRLASGALIDFEESHRLCGQCHGAKYRDWRAGIHGRRKGHWNGKKEYLLCVNCHWAHAPKFEPIEAMPPPKRPEALR